MNLPRGVMGVIVALACVLEAVAAQSKDDPLARVTPVAAGQPIPLVDFFRPPLLQDPQLNPSGTHLGALVTAGRDSTRFVSIELATGKTNMVGAPAKFDFHEFTWLNDRRVAVELVNEKLYAAGLYSVDVIDTKKSFPINLWNAGYLIGVPRARPLRPLYWISQNAFDEGKDGGLVELDAMRATKLTADIVPGMATMAGQASDRDRFGTSASISRRLPPLSEGIPSGYLVDRNGELAFGYSSVDGAARLFRFDDGRWTPAKIDLGETTVLDVGDAPGELVVLAPGAAGKPAALRRFNAVTGETGDVLWQDDRYECRTSRLYRHPVDGRVLGVQFPDLAMRSVWFDEQYHDVQQRLEAAFPERRVVLLGSDPAEKQFLVQTYSDVQPSEYFSVNLSAGSAKRVRSSRPWIDPTRMQPMQPFRFKARDGVLLDAYLTLPAGASKENRVPLIVLPHGGPWVRDVWGFDGEVQFFASRGYAVLQPNYRGSSGYDALYSDSDRYDFRKMHEDVTDALQAVLTTGNLDPDRVAILGTSFGGFLAGCAAAFEPTRYRCAVAIAGVFDWERHMKEARWHDTTNRRYDFLRRRLGDPAKQQEKFDAISPLKHAAEIRIPMFVAHGRSDRVVYVQQSQRFVAELKKHGVPHVAHFEKGEGHGMAYLDNEVELYDAIEKFLATNLAPRAKVAAK